MEWLNKMNSAIDYIEATITETEKDRKFIFCGTNQIILRHELFEKTCYNKFERRR